MKILRFLIATFGGYLLTALITITLSLVLPFENQAEATLLAGMLSFVFWLLFILYCYWIPSIKKLSIYFVLSSACLYALNTYVLV